jgi:hypothetical protein
MNLDKLDLVWSSAMDEYEKLTLEVLLDGYPVVRVNQENGVESCGRVGRTRTGRLDGSQSSP